MELKPIHSTNGREPLKVGWLIRYDGDIYKAMLVDDSRAYCVKLSTISKKVFTNKEEELSFAQNISSQYTISISPCSQVDVYGVHRSNIDKEILKRREQNGSK